MQGTFLIILAVDRSTAKKAAEWYISGMAGNDKFVTLSNQVMSYAP